jgi:hypothetical protein
MISPLAIETEFGVGMESNRFHSGAVTLSQDAPLGGNVVPPQRDRFSSPKHNRQ